MDILTEYPATDWPGCQLSQWQGSLLRYYTTWVHQADFEKETQRELKYNLAVWILKLLHQHLTSVFWYDIADMMHLPGSN